MTPIEIKIELLKRRKQTNMTRIGRELGVSHQAVQRVIERDSVSERIMVAVAAAIGQPPEIVFPEKQFKKQPV